MEFRGTLSHLDQIETGSTAVNLKHWQSTKSILWNFVSKIDLFQHYIEAFYELCKEIGGETEEAMCPLLEFEADRRCFLITINSFNTELTKDVREKLYPTCGKLYPEGLAMLNASEDFEQV